MSLETWIAFAAASAALLVMPGPTVLLVISYALSHGRRAAGATVAGVALGDATAMTASMLGLGALMAASADLFMAVKLAGAAYLVWLGLRLWRAPVAVGADGMVASSPTETRPWRIFGHAWLVSALNPKGIVFFVAFLPQFIDHGRPLVSQMMVLEATFLALVVANVTAYGLLATRARRLIRRPSVQRAVNRTGGTLMIGAGVMAAGWRRGAG
ncbi:lysine transporter LysE [Tistrella bauzanensis]|uniref:Lysine transporter LysE n=1 Tax=Tistrella bauzanensis TaxID=657419 RepID=A0ABQ1ISP1_9PROT|nr:LysE family translocator [Tistrella bauzanensis]GGB50163.1 lysine transporter LysE [Tistrella bauzanensis]